MRGEEAGEPMDQVTLPYKRMQVGLLMLLVLVPPTLYAASLGVQTGWHPVAVFALVVLLLALAALHAMTVRVDAREITVRLGFVPYAVRLKVAEIETAQRVRNEVRQLWGARPLDGGWMFSVSWLDAVELKMHDGSVYRIGTDRPDELLAAIEAAMQVQ